MTTFTPGKIWSDNFGTHINAHGGGLLIDEGVFYWFGEHKIAGEAGNAAHVGVHCYSSTDLYNWTDAGIALAVSDDPASEITDGCILERPKVIYNAMTGRYVMWFHLELKGHGYASSRVGVAVADRPAGPYTFLHSFRLNAGRWPENVTAEEQKAIYDAKLMAEMRAFHGGGPDSSVVRLPFWVRDFANGQMSRDMTLFKDDDGTAYHICASEENGTLHISQLSDDYLCTTGKYVRAFSKRWHEAPAVCKHNGRYWMITSDCTGWGPNAARSAVATSMWGPWRELGNPTEGINPDNGMGPEKTFGGQSTYILAVPGKADAFIAMFDLWRPQNAIDGRYLWLPMRFEDDKPRITWRSEWDLGVFDDMDV
jgi:beta-xylosidase